MDESGSAQRIDMAEIQEEPIPQGHISPVANDSLERLNLLVQNLSAKGLRVDVSRNTIGDKIRQRILNWLLGAETCQQLAMLPNIIHYSLQSLNWLEKRTSLKEFEISELIKREAEQIAQEIRAELTTIRGRTDSQDQRLQLVQQQLAQLDGICRGLESIIARKAKHNVKSSDAELSNSNNSSQDDIDYSYLLLENRFRGSEQVVKQRLSQYCPLFSHSTLPVLEIGAGRGELQTLFRESGVKSYGVELDDAMVEACSEKGLDVRFANGIEHLRGLADNSLSGVIAIQVIEHLPMSVLEELLILCRDKVVKSGMIVLETINTSSLLALSHNYFRDPTHVHPLHPDTMRYLAEQAGLEVVEVKLSSAYPEEAQLQSIDEQVYYSESLREVVQYYNQTTSTLNSVLFGHQDYALIARPSQ